MKIRIKGNSLRYRLTKSEVSTLAEQGIIQEKTDFPANTLTYAIKASTWAELTADFKQSTITLHVPQNILKQWADTDQVSIESNMLLPDGSTFYLLLEKDFKCIDVDADEDQSDFFENPHLAC
ncbi:hypothetical protein [Mucilaginibacter sp. CSA2-8R]|uniref:DUF7009 family protein n=1 Tax=Mucilaginibacter sp. CSA2-8R TaxID=3141542 RepID=UPI00315CE190